MLKGINHSLSVNGKEKLRHFATVYISPFTFNQRVVSNGSNNTM